MKQERAQVYMTSRAYVDVLTEVSSHPYVETGGILVAARCRNIYYLIESTDSGMNAQYLYARFDRDYDYTEHLGNIIARKYDLMQEADMVLLQWHRHPDGCMEFSRGDQASNDEFARIYHGNISGLVTVSPRFSLRFWEIPPEGGTPLPIHSFSINDREVEKVIRLKSAEELINQIEMKEHPDIFHSRRIVPDAILPKPNADHLSETKDFGLGSSGLGEERCVTGISSQRDLESEKLMNEVASGGHEYRETNGNIEQRELYPDHDNRVEHISEKGQAVDWTCRLARIIQDVIPKRKMRDSGVACNVQTECAEMDESEPPKRKKSGSMIPLELLEEMKENSIRGYQIRVKILSRDLILLYVTDPEAIEYEMRFYYDEDGNAFLSSLPTGEYQYKRGVLTNMFYLISESDYDE